MITKNSGIILGAMVFEDNPYDGNTLEPQLEQVSNLLGKLSKVALVDKSYNGRKTIHGARSRCPVLAKVK